MKLATTRRSVSRTILILTKVILSIFVTAVGVLQTNLAVPSELRSALIATPPPQQPILVATAYTDITLPTLRRGDRGRSVRMLQQILSDNGFLGAAGVGWEIQVVPLSIVHLARLQSLQ